MTLRPREPFSVGAIPALFAAAFASWREDKATRMAAALAYYTLFSIPPFLIFLVGLLGPLFDHQPIQERLVRTIEHLVGPQGAAAIRDILRTVTEEGNHARATVVGIVTLLLGASGLFGHLKDSLNTVWEVEPKPGLRIRSFMGQYVFSVMALLGTGFLLLVSLSVNALLAAAGEYLGRVLPGGATLWQVVNAVFSLGAIAFLFALLFRYIPDATVAWRDALVGGGVTSVLFTTGEILIGIYLGRTNVGSAFGAAGSLVVLLVWVYYSSSIFFFGAECTKAYSDRYGSRILPDEGAIPATAKSREQQGLPKRR